MTINPLVRVQSDADINAEEEARRAAEEAESEQQRKMTGVAAYLELRWQAAYMAKQEITDRLNKCARQRAGEHEADVLAQIKAYGGNEEYLRLTDNKCRALVAWIGTIVRNTAVGKPWDLSGSSIPDIPPEAMQMLEQEVMVEALQVQAALGRPPDPSFLIARKDELKQEVVDKAKALSEKAAEAMEDRVQDILVDGGFYKALDAFIDDLATYPTAFLKGNIRRRRKVLTWVTTATGGMIPVGQDDVVSEFEAVSPYDMFPAPAARQLNKTWFFERHRWTREELMSLVGVDGYDVNAIEAVLEKYPAGFSLELTEDTDREIIESVQHEEDDPEGLYDVLEFWGTVPAHTLAEEWGLATERSYYDEVPVCAFKIDRFIIGLWENDHPLGKSPYFCTSYKKVNNSIWGTCPPELMADIQHNANATSRHLVNNLAIGSGPQVGVDKTKLPDKFDWKTMYPWKVWPFDEEDVKITDVLSFYQPMTNVGELIGYLRFLMDLASEVTGIPAYAYGNEDVGGAARTASGLSMLMNAATKAIKRVIQYIDEDVIEPCLENEVLYLMIREPEKALLIGDVNIKAKASSYLIMSEQRQMRLNELLQVLVHPAIQAVVGPKGTAYILREMLKDYDLDIDKAVPDLEQAIKDRIEEMQQLGPMALPMGGQPQQGQGMVPPTQGETQDLAGNRMAGQSFSQFNPLQRMSKDVNQPRAPR